MSLAAKLTPHAPKALAALRIMTALLFLQHGLGKFFHFPDVPMFAGMNLFSGQIFSLMGLAAILETFGSLALLVGLCTRPVDQNDALAGMVEAQARDPDLEGRRIDIQRQGALGQACAVRVCKGHGAAAAALSIEFFASSRSCPLRPPALV